MLVLGPEHIPESLYKQIYDLVPIFCADVIAVNERGQFLTVKRLNDPLKGVWAFPGGRVLKNEPVAHAAVRKLKEETRLDGAFVRYVGFYEFIDSHGYFEGTSVHTPVVVSLVTVHDDTSVAIDNQSSDFHWSDRIDPALPDYAKEMLALAGFEK